MTRENRIFESQIKTNIMRYLVLSLLLAATTVFAQALPSEVSTLFNGSGTCVMCHESDGVLMTENGADISPITMWRSTMMGNSAKDPLWRAKVATELAAFPQHSDLIQNRCTICHVPAGFTQARYDSIENYTLAMLDADPLARDGVTCTVCHQIEPDNFGTPESYSGHYQITDERLIYGPFELPLTWPMFNNTGFDPAYSPHVHQSELCATCHTLFTPSLDANGNIIGEFPEQTPYIEWKNSFYGQEGQSSCQDCHMRLAQDAQDISLLPPWHQELRSPYRQHAFVGANITMLKILRDHADELGVTALSQHFDSTIAETQRSLSQRSVDMHLDVSVANDSVYLNVELINLTGHKIPTGIPLRRMWLHVRAENNLGNVVFESGAWDEHGEIVGYDTPFEPHHDVITDPGEVQVYEAVMGDNENQRTWTLLRAIQHLKDNRLPPLGFTTSHASYDTVEIYGVPASDTNYNRVHGTEGSGSDLITYRLPACANISVSVKYQTVQPQLVNYISGHDLPETNTFVSMYNTQSHEPLHMITETIEVLPAEPAPAELPERFALLPAYPNPFNNTTRLPLELTRSMMVEFSVYDIRGRRVQLFGRMMNAGRNEVSIDGTNLSSGVYMVRAQAGQVRDTQRIILIK
jgi:hypothetical protein